MKKDVNKKYWLSLEQWGQDKDFQALAKKGGEFLKPLPGDADALWERREFLQLMAASMALAGFGCVRRPTEKIVPYVKRPEDVNLGENSLYSSSYYDGEEGFGLLIKTREGRPIKIEGNKNHPMNQGALSVRAHSHILSLYDPERLQQAQQNLFNEEKSNRESIRADYSVADKTIATQIRKGRVAFLTGEWPSPSSERLLRDFCKNTSSTHYVWNPLNHAAQAEAQKLCYGKSFVPRVSLDRARFILSINCDFLGTWVSPTEFNRLYSKGRKANIDMNRLVVFESLLSLTGTNADWRVRIKPSQQLELILSLIHSLKERNLVNVGLPKSLKVSVTPWKTFHIEKSAWEELISDLWKNRGQSVVLSGGNTSVQVACALLNHLLQNAGKTLDYSKPYRIWAGANRNIYKLIKDLEQKKIKTVIIHRTNPLYTYPDKVRLEKALKQAEMVIYTGDREDETGRLAHYILPDHHDLEKWSDWEFQKGILSVQQPTISPLYATRAFEDSLIKWSEALNKTDILRGTNSWYEYLRKNVSATEGDGFSWDNFLKTGVSLKNFSGEVPNFRSSALNFIKNPTVRQTGEYELQLYTTIGLKDGSLANVSWLQEFPDPVTKICWGNYLCVSPATARNKKLKEGQVVKLKTASQQVEVPVHIQPGQADGVLALALGYGRERAGKVAHKIGVNAWNLAKISDKGELFYSSLSADIELTPKQEPLANTQGHHSMEGRQIVVETTLKKYLKNPGGAIHRHKMFSLWSSHDYPRHKWGMVIDLNSCTGCSVCVTACQSENNIPTVGKELVMEGREMHWIRVDRYYKGTPENPETVHQPIVCMHCDNAPCETVCPVAATVHSDEGTNDMIYNRCVGTRYCANNCPYKVRRFNWFNYAKKVEKPPLNMSLNPDVSVRSRGVMEKCTFCIHRIRSAQAQAKLEDRLLKDGDVQTACQQSCPTGAIVFGDLKDKSSNVYRQFEKENSYSLLEELNTKPAVRYQVKVRNKKASEVREGEEGHHG